MTWRHWWEHGPGETLERNRRCGGPSTTTAGTLHYAMGGAVLVELALASLVEVENGKVVPVGGAPEDPLPRFGYEKVAEKPRFVDAVLLKVGAGMWQRVVDRLVDRGFVRREKKRVLGVFRMTALPAEDTRREEEVR